MIVGDGSQSLYRKRDFTWADAGIHASGRVINRKFDLDRNYRNTAEILRAARAFSVPPGSGVEGVLALPVEPDTAIRSGPEPWLIRLDDAASEMHYAAALIETWLRGGLEIGGRPQRVQPSDIAVLYPRRRPDAAVTALCDRLNGFTRAVLPAALIAGENDPAKLARLADQRVKASQDTLREALRGRVTKRHRFLLRLHLGQIDALDAAIAELDREVEASIAPFRTAIEQMSSIPGVKHLSARAILSEIGIDMSRFATDAHLISWAWAAMRTKGTYLQAQFHRIRARRGAKKAIVAVAASILTAIYHMLKDGTMYQDLGPNHFDRRSKEQQKNRLLKRLADLGYVVQLAPSPN